MKSSIDLESIAPIPISARVNEPIHQHEPVTLFGDHSPEGGGDVIRDELVVDAKESEPDFC